MASIQDVERFYPDWPAAAADSISMTALLPACVARHTALVAPRPEHRLNSPQPASQTKTALAPYVDNPVEAVSRSNADHRRTLREAQPSAGPLIGHTLCLIKEAIKQLEPRR